MKDIIQKTCFLLRRKTAVLTLAVMMGLVLMQFANNLSAFRGLDVKDMLPNTELGLLSLQVFALDPALMLVQVYPLLVTLPAGLIFADNRSCGIEISEVSRIGRKKYVASRLCACFLATAIVFTLPLLIELLVNLICFPSDTGYYSGSVFEAETIDRIRRFLFYRLYVSHPVLYVFLLTLLFGICSGIFGAMSAGISLLFRSKFKLMYFIPMFVLLNGSAALIKVIVNNNKIALSWADYLFLYTSRRKSVPVLFLTIILLVLFLIMVSIRKGKEDTL